MNDKEFLDNGARNPKERAEYAYRRGFQQGAHACLEAAIAHGFKPGLFRMWVGVKLHDWRFKQLTKSRNKKPPAAPIPSTKSENVDRTTRKITRGSAAL